MTYRVVQVSDDHLEAAAGESGAVSVVSTAAFAGAPQAVAQVSKGQRELLYRKPHPHFSVTSNCPESDLQAVIQNPFSNGGSPGAETVSGETRFAYFPTSAVSDGAAVSLQTADPTITQAGGEKTFWLLETFSWRKPSAEGNL